MNLRSSVLRAVVLGCVLSALAGFPARAQKATEVFIPIGDSPGLSRVTSVIGTIESFDDDTRVVTVRGERGEHRARLTRVTKIWLDRSEIRRTSGAGTHADCRRGRLCEIKYVYRDGTRTDEAEWIKIRVDER